MICKKCKRTVKHPYGVTRDTLTCGACRGIKTQIGKLVKSTKMEDVHKFAELLNSTKTFSGIEGNKCVP